MKLDLSFIDPHHVEMVENRFLANLRERVAMTRGIRPRRLSFAEWLWGVFQ